MSIPKTPDYLNMFVKHVACWSPQNSVNIWFVHILRCIIQKVCICQVLPPVIFFDFFLFSISTYAECRHNQDVIECFATFHLLLFLQIFESALFITNEPHIFNQFFICWADNLLICLIQVIARKLVFIETKMFPSIISF